MFLVTPPSLGAYAARRTAVRVRSELTAAGDLPAPVRGAIPLTVTDFSDRVGYGQDLRSGRYRLVGFVVPSKDPDASFDLTRMKIACCAADATTVQVPVVGIGDPPAEGTWLEVEGSEVVSEAGVPHLAVETYREVADPAEPYE